MNDDDLDNQEVVLTKNCAVCPEFERKETRPSKLTRLWDRVRDKCSNVLFPTHSLVTERNY